MDVQARLVLTADSASAVKQGEIMKKYFLFFAMAVLLIAGCGRSQNSEPSIEILKPVGGDLIKGTDVSVAIKLDNAQFSRRGINKAGEGHIHMTLDDETFIMILTNTYVYDQVSPGEHTFTAEFRNNDHTAYEPRIIKKVSFTVKS